MSNIVPTFRTKDRVRVMDTDDPQLRFMANRRGLVIGTWFDASGHQMCRVQTGKYSAILPASCLTRYKTCV